MELTITKDLHQHTLTRLQTRHAKGCWLAPIISVAASYGWAPEVWIYQPKGSGSLLISVTFTVGEDSLWAISTWRGATGLLGFRLCDDCDALLALREEMAGDSPALTWLVVSIGMDSSAAPLPRPSNNRSMTRHHGMTWIRPHRKSQTKAGYSLHTKVSCWVTACSK